MKEMTLREYIMMRKVDSKFTIKIMAEAIDISAQHLQNVMNRYIGPSWKLACRIENYTKGQVKAGALLSEDYQSKKPNHNPSKKTKMMTKNAKEIAPTIAQNTSG